MTHSVQQLVALLERLPAAEQEKYGARWLGELVEGEGDGATSIEPGKQTRIPFDAIKHLLGVFDGGPSDLSSNPSYIDNIGAKKQVNTLLQKAVMAVLDLPETTQDDVARAMLDAIDQAQNDSPRRPVGLAAGKVHVPDTFFDPLPEDELALWNGETPSDRP